MAVTIQKFLSPLPIVPILLCVGLVLITSFVKRNSIEDKKPLFTSKPITRVHVDGVYNYVFTAMDSLGKPLTFSVVDLPGWLAYSSSNHSIKGKAVKTGQYPVHIVATNGVSTTHQYFMVTVFDKETVNILALGNSITNGTNKYNSYRRALWQKLHKANYNFDFIGSWDKHHMGGEVPNPDFDMDHEGHSGWTAGHIFTPPDWDQTRGSIHDWLKSYTPDIVLVELGTNDVFQCRTADDVIKDFRELVSLLRKNNKRVKILFASVLPLGKQWSGQNLCKTSPYGEIIMDINRKITTFVAEEYTKESPVILVDQFTGIDPSTMMYDDIHPNDVGEKEIARRWFNALEKIGVRS